MAHIVNDTDVTYLHNDHLGTPFMGTDASGNELWEEEYTPYGEKYKSHAANDDLGGYTGHIYDSATGLNYMQARYHDPVIGRFLANDPVGFLEHLGGEQGVQGFNRYAYANNNPYKYVDPDGEAIVPVGTPAEVKQINAAINKIEKSNQQSAARVASLRTSKHTHTVRFPKSGERPVNKTTGVRSNESVKGVGTGSETIVDVNKPITLNGKGAGGSNVTLSGESVLAHELLGHGGDKDAGVIDRSINPSTGQKKSEESAMNAANEYRRAVDEQERVKY